MSEADSPNQEVASFAVNEPSSTSTSGSDAVAPTSRHDGDNGEQTDGEQTDSEQADGWQTVDFPGAVSIDALPQLRTQPVSEAGSLGTIHYDNATIDPETTIALPLPEPLPVSSDAALAKLMQQLEQENAELRDRLTQVEQDFVQQQIEWQLESVRASMSEASPGSPVSLAQPTGAIDQTQTEQHQPLEAAQQRLKQLFQALELSHQASQRQQILVETLTEQLTSSQERIAQLERNCALTQQRHTEQLQQVLQAENTCRDLRMRLHRQQQQTLQFKAALEKCLEMPTPHGQGSFMPDLYLNDQVVVPPASYSELLKPKTQPVKPWSAPIHAAELPAIEPIQLERPNALFGRYDEPLVEQTDHSLALEPDAGIVPWSSLDAVSAASEQIFQTEAEQAAISDRSLETDEAQLLNLMQLVFPEAPEYSPYTNTDALQTDALQTEPIFDLAPFLNPESLTSELDAMQPSAMPAPSADWSQPSFDAAEALSQLRYGLNALSLETDAIATDLIATDLASTDAYSKAEERSGEETVWDNLARLIDPAASAADLNLDAAIDEKVALTSALTPIEDEAVAATDDMQANSDKAGDRPSVPAIASSDATEAIAPRLGKRPQLTTWMWTDHHTAESATDVAKSARSTTAQTATPNPSPFLTTGSMNKPGGVSQGESTAKTIALNSPSPIVYPLRSTKKLTSLAAVDLPTFPKR